MILPKLTDFNLREKSSLQSKTVLVRVDIDVPLVGGKVQDDTRIRACLPTIEYLLKNGAKVILMGHLGRPNGKVIEKLSLKPVAEKFKELLKLKVQLKISPFAPSELRRDRQNSKVRLNLQGIPVYILGENLWLLENLRFYPGEEQNNNEFARNLSLLGDFYINEAFAASHREHASIVGLPKLLPHCAGFNFIKEIENLSKVLENPQKPVVFVIGGAKPETKLTLVGDLVSKSDFILVGGLLPLTQNNERRTMNNGKIIWGNLTKDGLDIDGQTIKKFIEIIQKAGTIVWNGPMGEFEAPEGAMGTKEIAEAIANSSAFKVVGGGDTLAALNNYGFSSKIDFISLGGGAMLEFLAKGNLPGIQAISNQSSAIRQKKDTGY